MTKIETNDIIAVEFAASLEALEKIKEQVHQRKDAISIVKLPNHNGANAIFIASSPKASHILGVEDDPTGQTYTNFIHRVDHTDAEYVSESLEYVLRAKRKMQLELQWHMKTGQIRTLGVTVNKMRDYPVKLYLITGQWFKDLLELHVSDVSDQKAAEWADSELTSAPNLEAAVSAMAGKLQTGIGAQNVTLLVMHPHEPDLIIENIIPPEQANRAFPTIMPSYSTRVCDIPSLDYMAQTGLPILLPDVNNSDYEFPWLPNSYGKSAQFPAVIGYPYLQHPGDYPQFYIFCSNGNPGHFQEADISVVDAMAPALSSVVDRFYEYAFQ